MRGFTSAVDFCMGVWSVTPYRLCSYRCSYCCTNVQGRSEPAESREAAWSAIDVAIAEQGDAFWCVGGLSDAYPPEEAEYQITRGIVQRLVDADRHFSIITKSTLVERDTDLLARASRGRVTVSLGSVDSAALGPMEGTAPPAEERLVVLHRLHANGVSVDVNVLPFVPQVTDFGAILVAVPHDVELTVGPLGFGDHRHEATFGGTRYRRSEVWDNYLAAYEEWGHISRARWIRPSLPPEENNPYAKMPVLDAPGSAPGDLRQRLVDIARSVESTPVAIR